MQTDKLILTHRAALRGKYGNGARAIDAAIKALIAADKARGLVSRRIDIDATVPAPGAGAAATTLRRLTKDAIDAAFKRHDPDYLMIVGGPDVVVMQELANPMNANHDPGDDDDDVVVPSDLPYACEQAYSDDAADFLGPTRVIGRLPDLPDADDPAYLVSVLKHAAQAKTRPREEYSTYFGLTAAVWKKSTHLSLENMYGDASKLRVSPPSGPTWSASALAPRIHFINCHGGDKSPRYYGQKTKDAFPTAHFSPKLAGKVSTGTVVAAECCYGAQLYDPAEASEARNQGIPGIAATYLAEGAWGVFGSTTIAYGPSEGNGQADLICQYFIRAVRDGASLGRAALEARHRFASQLSHLDPSDLKTLAQFILLGDPSIQAVASPTHALARTPAFKRAFGGHASPGSRMFRRERMTRTGHNLAHTLGAVEPIARPSVPLGVERVLRTIARESGLGDCTLRAYRVVKGGRTKKEVAQRRIYTLSGAIGGRVADGGRVVSIVATTERGQIVHLRRVHSR